jgi:hypothetical protein
VFCLGPYIVRSSDNSDAAEGVAFTEHALEFSTPDWKLTVPVYRNTHSNRSSTPCLADLVFHENLQELDLNLWPHQVVSTPNGRFLPLGSYVSALYSRFPSAQPIGELLDDLRNSISIVERNCLRRFNNPEWVSPALKENGFEITDAISHGRQFADFEIPSQLDCRGQSRAFWV